MFEDYAKERIVPGKIDFACHGIKFSKEIYAAYALHKLWHYLKLSNKEKLYTWLHLLWVRTPSTKN